MNAPQLSMDALNRMYRIQLEGVAQRDCECENGGDLCTPCEAREELCITYTSPLKETAMSYQTDLHENIAAISGELWGGNSTFYARHGASLSGFPGVWRYAIDAAQVFTTAEQKFEEKYGNKPEASFEYLDAILPYAEWLRDSVELPSQAEQAAKAEQLILAASTAV